MMEKTPYELLNGRRPNIAYFSGFGCKCYILKKGTRLRKFEKKCDTLEEVHDVEFNVTNGSQEDDENLDDVRGTQLTNAIKNMDIGD